MDYPVSWFEVLEAEPEQTAKFYSELFGWNTQWLPEFEYGLVETNAGAGINGGVGKSPAGGSTVSIYVAPSDLQAVLDRAESLGGKTVVPVTETSMVTFAQFSDPAGNVIGLVLPTESGGQVGEGDGVPVDWFEILGPDARALWSFYRELFGWEIEEGGGEGFLYGQVQLGRTGGGIGSSPDGSPKVNVYARVDDLQRYLDRAETLGGKTVLPPTEMEHVAFAQFSDPQGATFGLWAMRDH